MKMFDNKSSLMRAYLHFSYAFAMTVVVLLLQQLVCLALGEAKILDMSSLPFLSSLGVGTVALSGMLYLHLPKMIDRCYTIGRKFGL